MTSDYKCQHSPLYIGNLLAFARRFNYTDGGMHRHLGSIIGLKEEVSLEFTNNDFLDLLKEFIDIGATHMRVYFASYIDLPINHPLYEKNRQLIKKDASDRDRNKKLTIIFRSVNRTESFNDKPVSGYYYIHDKKGLIKNIEHEIAEAWIDHWENDKRIKLAKLMGMEQQGQTRSLLFNLEDVAKLYAQLLCWGESFKNVTVYFAAYSRDEEHNGESVGKQLSLIFYCRDNFPFLIQLTKAFLDDLNKYLKNKLLGGNNNDTGSPCPPSSNCP